jgi:hypothetical protein
MENGDLSLAGSFNDVLHHRLYFGRADAGASVIGSKEFRVFENGVGQQEKNISTDAIVTLNPADSSQDGKGGTIPNAQSFVIAAIGIHVSVSSVQATTPKTDDSVDTVDVTPLYRVSPIPLVETIANQCTFELWKNANIRMERGVVNEYPCQFGLQGFSGGGQSTIAGVTGDVPAAAGFTPGAAYGLDASTLIQTNGMMFRPLTVYQVLESLDQFYGVFEPRVAIDLALTLLTGHIDFYLVGLLADDYTARQFVANFVG